LEVESLRAFSPGLLALDLAEPPRIGPCAIRQEVDHSPAHRLSGGSPREGARSEAEQRLAAGGPQGSPDPEL
jgi:hypothetical protein